MTGSQSLVDQIYDLHNEVCDQFDLDHPGVKSQFPNIQLGKAVDDAFRETNPYAEAAALLKNIIDCHVFEDGNKRTATLVAIQYLRNRECQPKIDPHNEGTDKIIRNHQRFTVDEFASWLETGQIDESRLPR